MPRLAIHSDLTQMFEFSGAIAGMSRTVSTNVFKGDVLTFAHSEMAREFDLHASLMAGMNVDRYSHVYEWRMTGQPAGQLWRHKLSGPMNNKLATFEWMASRQPILTPRERKSNPRDPMSMVPDDEIAKLSSRKYIFHWKAPMMEYGMETVIAPKWAKALFIPTGRFPDTFVIHKSPVYKRAGGSNTKGAFTELWTQWWGSSADGVFDRSVNEMVTADIGESVRRVMRKNRTARPLTAKIGGIASPHVAFESGRMLAEAYLKTRARSYRAASKYLKETYG